MSSNNIPSSSMPPANVPVRTLRPSDFEMLSAQSSAPVMVRPSRSYWQDAWARLKTNKRALVSLYIVIALLLFTFAGPLVWQVDPARQDVDQISVGPGVDRRAIVVAPWQAWNGVSLAPGYESAPGLRLAADPTTQNVRLQWDEVPGAASYRLYRSLFPAGETGGLGLPMADFSAADRRWYEDLMDLQPREYFYTVVARDADGEQLEPLQAVSADVRRVITIDEVRAKELDVDVEALQPGDEVYLAFHPLGTDYLGRDMLARLMAGAQVSLFIGLLAPLLFVSFGVLYGATAGFVGGRVDQVMMRIADFVVALPFLLFMILFQVVFGIGPGESGIIPMMVALVLLSWPATARLVRGQIMQIREEAYVSAARLLGGSHLYLIFRHMIPNTLGVILVTLTFAVPSAIFTEAFLSFIGMGVAPPTASWGSMSNEALKTMLTHPHELFFPALMISITVLAFNLLGDGLRDALDARMRGTE